MWQRADLLVGLEHRIRGVDLRIHLLTFAIVRDPELFKGSHVEHSRDRI